MEKKVSATKTKISGNSLLKKNFFSKFIFERERERERETECEWGRGRKRGRHRI